MSTNLTLGFFGAGKMATALAESFIHAGLVKASQVIASDVSEGARSVFGRQTGAKTTASNRDVAEFANVLILAVKPNAVPELLDEVRPVITERHLLLSIAAGVPLAKLEAGLPQGSRVIRVMPNMPAMVGASAGAYALGQCATASDAELAGRLLSSSGMSFQLKESLLDAVTGLSGSGPAFVFLFIEALSDGGVAAGLPRELATKLAAQTVLGAAKMVLETGLHPGLLKDLVASPGGTTIDGLHELEKAAVRGSIISAVRVAAEKSKKLGEGK